MTDKPNSFETTERHERADKSGYYEYVQTPDFRQPVYPTTAEFIFKASKVLSDFRKQWMNEHDDHWATGLEMDCIPVMSDGVIMGYLGVSEISGEEYDYFPAKHIEEDDQ